MLGIIVALQSETDSLSKYFNKLHKISINGFNGYLCEVLNTNVVIIYSGVGISNAAAAVMSLINNFSVTNIINIGSAGSVSNKLPPKNIFIPESVQYVDVDATGFGYRINQVPHEPESFDCSNKLNLLLKEIIKEYQPNFINGSLGTSNSFVNKNNINKFNIGNVLACDMEACGISQICYKNNVNFSCVKIVSDSIYDTSSSENQWSSSIKSISTLVSEIIYNVSYKFVYSFELNK